MKLPFSFFFAPCCASVPIPPTLMYGGAELFFRTEEHYLSPTSSCLTWPGAVHILPALFLHFSLQEPTNEVKWRWCETMESNITDAVVIMWYRKMSSLHILRNKRVVLVRRHYSPQETYIGKFPKPADSRVNTVKTMRRRAKDIGCEMGQISRCRSFIFWNPKRMSFVTYDIMCSS